MRRTDLITAALLAVAGLVAILVVIPRYVTDSGGSGDLSPAFMPYVAAVLATGAMVALLLARVASPAGGDEAESLPQASWRFLGLAAAAFAVSLGLMELVGYLAGASALVAALLKLARSSLRVSAVAAVALPLATWLLLTKILAMPLP